MKKLLTVLVLLFSGSAWGGDIQDGKAAYDINEYAKAMQKFKTAAKVGDAVAQTYIGIMYEHGQGVVQDYVEAVRWYKLAAAQGERHAQAYLGLMYHKGDGVAKDYLRAHMWYNLAAVGGVKSAGELRDLFVTIMPEQQIAQAQQMARDCQARNFKNCD